MQDICGINISRHTECTVNEFPDTHCQVRDFLLCSPRMSQSSKEAVPEESGPSSAAGSSACSKSQTVSLTYIRYQTYTFPLWNENQFYASVIRELIK